MGLAVKLFCFLLILGVAGLFFIKKPDGTPWLSLEEFIPDTRSIKTTISDAIPEQIIGGGDEESVVVYKWKDKEGNWQFSDKPPANISAEQVLVGTDVNRDLAPLPPPETTLAPKNSDKGGRAIFIKDSSSPTPSISPDKVSTLIDDAKNVQQIMDNRKEQLDSALNSSGN